MLVVLIGELKSQNSNNIPILQHTPRIYLRGWLSTILILGWSDRWDYSRRHVCLSSTVSDESFSDISTVAQSSSDLGGIGGGLSSWTMSAMEAFGGGLVVTTPIPFVTTPAPCVCDHPYFWYMRWVGGAPLVPARSCMLSCSRPYRYLG